MKRKTLWLTIILMILGTTASAQEERVLFSSPGGLYQESFDLSLYCFYTNHHIHYTTNGNAPTASSPRYEQPLTLDESLYCQSNYYTIPVCLPFMFYAPDSVDHVIVIRAAVFDDAGQRLSEVATNTYLITSLGFESHGLPVLSIAADSLDLFGYETGILVPGINHSPTDSIWTGNYFGSGMEWERRVSVEFFEPDGECGIRQEAGIRTHGGTGRYSLQKGMKIYAREIYGEKRFHHKFFEELPYDSYKHLVLKPFTCRWFSHGIQDDICNRMANELNMEALASRPAMMYLNGEFWGIYYIKEKPDAHYLEDHFGNEDLDYNVMESWYGDIADGDNTNFNQMMEWLKNSDMTQEADYMRICSMIDIDCFIDYYCFELFIANNDWPGNNMRCYQLHDGIWRWIFFDGDDCLMKMNFDVFDNATSVNGNGWPNSPRATLLFRKLLENHDFRQMFANRFTQLLVGTFSYQHTHPLLEEAAARVREAVPAQAQRFGVPTTSTQWENLVSNLDHFLEERCSNMFDRLNQFLNIDTHDTLPDFIVAPNPVSDHFSVIIDSHMAGYTQLRIFDLLGRLVYEKTLILQSGENNLRFDITLRPGEYILKIGGSSKPIIVLNNKQ